MFLFNGLCPPLITPFDQQGKIDLPRMRQHVDFMIAGGANGLCVGSTTGEFCTLTRQEWEELLCVVKDQAAGRVPVMAGTAALSTVETIERSRFAEQMGYDGLLIISPWYQVHTQRELYAHFKAVRNAVTLPIMIYNNPAVTGIHLGADLLERMADDGIIQYVKDANPDPYGLARLKIRLGDRVGLFYGHDCNVLGGLAFGAIGWFSGTSNLDPVRWSKLVQLCLNNGDYDAARRIWYEIMPFIDLTVVGEGGERADWIAVIKRGMELRGQSVGTVRPPMLPLTETVDAKLRRVVAAMTFADQPTSPSPSTARTHIRTALSSKDGDSLDREVVGRN